MVDLNKAAIAKLRKDGKEYEIFIDSENALRLRKGESISVADVVPTEEIFYDAKKGLRASENELKRVFGTDDKSEICRIIIREGHVPLTVDLMRKELDAKRKQIANMIHRNVIDPKTGKPHPQHRIEAAIDEAKIKIDASRSAEQQMQEVIDSIRKIIPLKYEVREISIRIQPQYSGRAFPILKKYGKLLGENWQNDGSLLAKLEIPAGIQEELEIALNNIAKGTVEVNILRTK